MMISGDAFEAYQQATGATMDNTTGLLKFTPEQYKQLESMFFNIGGVRRPGQRFVLSHTGFSYRLLLNLLPMRKSGHARSTAP